MENNPFYDPLLKYCKVLVGDGGQLSDFPGTAKELTLQALKKASRNTAFGQSSHNSILASLEQLARYKAIDQITMSMLRKFHASGNFDIWERIVELNYDLLLNYCRKLLNGDLRAFRGEADDVVHVTFLKAQSKASDLKTDKCSSLQPWLQRTAKNWIVDETRKQANQSLYLEDMSSPSMDTERPTFEPVDSDHPGPETSLNLADRHEQVDKAVDGLTTKSKTFVRLHDAEKKSMRRIAEEHNISIDKVKYKLNKARAKLKSILSDKDL